MSPYTTQSPAAMRREKKRLIAELTALLSGPERVTCEVSTEVVELPGLAGDRFRDYAAGTLTVTLRVHRVARPKRKGGGK